MHELAMAQGVLDVALDVAGDDRVRLVRVRVGELQRVVPDSLRFCFQLVAQGSAAEQAELVIDETAGDDFRVIEVETVEAGDGGGTGDGGDGGEVVVRCA